MDRSATVNQHYFVNLDGLRAICFLLVFLFHGFYTEYDYLRNDPVYQFVKFSLLGNGNLGVNFFFVLSGFLITWLLIQEKKDTGSVNVPRFYLKRILRIWPLFFFCVFFGFVIFPLLKETFHQIPNETAHTWMYIFFLNNFDIINNGLPDASVLGVLWSIAVEEQFYLVWPLVLLLLPIRAYPWFFAFVIVVSLVWRGFHPGVFELEYHTLSCMNDLAVGALGAWLATFASLIRKFETLRRRYIILLYAIVAVILLFRREIIHISIEFMIVERFFIAMLFMAIIAEQNYSKNSFFKLGKYKALTSVGIITYGLYCLQFVSILVVTNVTKLVGWNTMLWQVLILDTLLALGLLLVIGKVSYVYFETPFLRLREKF